MKKKIKAIISEELNKFTTEGVADIFAREKFGIPNPDDYGVSNDSDNDNIVYRIDDWKLIKNPKSLEYLGSKVRGVIMPNGDFYCENFAKKIHYDLLEILNKISVLSSIPKKNWSVHIPQDSGFLTVQRYQNSDTIAIGESNRLIFNVENYNKYIHYYDEFLTMAKKKNPNINFENKLVGVKQALPPDQSIIMK